MEGFHHPFGPSSLNRRQQCPASYNEELQYENIPVLIDSEVAIERESGNKCHLALKTMIFDDLDATEMDMVKRCLKVIAEDEMGAHIVEHEMPITITGSNGEIISYGTLDYAAIFIKDGIANLEDWKFGYLPVAAASENIQVAAYSAGLMERYKLSKVNAGIYQPRWNRHDKFPFTNREGIVQTIENIIAECKKPDAKYNPSEDTCRYCKAKLTCPALRQALANFKIEVNLPDLPDEKLNRLCSEYALIEKFGEAIKKEQKLRIKTTGRCGNLGFNKQSNGFHISDVQQAFKRVSHLISFGDYMNLLEISDAQLRDTIIPKLINIAAGQKQKLTKKVAEGTYATLMGDIRLPKEPKNIIIELE